MGKYYVYAHIRKDTNSIFYIGKGSGNRAYFKSNRGEYWKRIVRKHGYDVVFLAENLEEKDAYEAEIIFIAAEKLKGGCEANFTIGGDGIRVEKRWWQDKITAALRGKVRKRGAENKNFKDVISKEELQYLYVERKLGSIEISKLKSISYTTICARLKEYGIEKREAGKPAVKIKCTTDGHVFDSINDAAKFYSLRRENIRKVLKGIYSHTGKKHFIKI